MSENYMAMNEVELYEETLEKWEKVLEEFKTGTVLGAYFLGREKCAFCYNTGDTKNCGKCLIDHSICDMSQSYFYSDNKSLVGRYLSSPSHYKMEVIIEALSKKLEDIKNK